MFEFLSEKVSSVFTRLTGQHKLSESNIIDTLKKVQESLLEADVPYDVVQAFIVQLKEKTIGATVLKAAKPAEQFIKIAHETLTNFLTAPETVKPFIRNEKTVAVVMGLQGSGKTTTIAKLVAYQKIVKKKHNLKVLLASVDFYRPAAVDQLEILSEQVSSDFYRARSEKPVKAAQEIVAHFNSNKYDLLLLDTAGRLHVDSDMLEELKQVVAIAQPQEKILVLDAMTGQESLSVAQAFNEAVGFDWAVLSKMDSNARAGSAFAFAFTLAKSIQFVGTGERVDELERFHPKRVADRILGMGDLQTLIEKFDRLEKQQSQKEQEDSAKRMMQGKMNLEDFAQQLEMMSKMGPFTQLMQYMPGFSAANVSREQLAQGENQIKRFRAALSSMTLKERFQPTLLNNSRKKRIAQGAGVSEQEINEFLQRFEETQRFVKLMGKSGRFPSW